ncbi:MAG TPA: acyl-CoA dehydrogenase [Polyangia bacterium]|jgi:acyl-CoA dehydrogenase
MKVAIIACVVLAIGLFPLLLYKGRGYLAWVLAGALLLAAWALTGPAGPVAFGLVAGLFVLAAVVFGVPGVRRQVITRPLMPVLAGALPRMGDTERIALEAGSVWWDGELFSGDPNWRRLLEFTPRGLTERELAFMAGPVEQLCAMLDDYRVSEDGDLPGEVWALLKRERFFGMIIPEEYGGLGFSAAAHSAVVTRVGTCSPTAAVTVMVPNSLGPAELLLHYGTDEQKAQYLPRLAKGEEIPCFGLTGPEAGSDAAATTSTGVVTRGRYGGREVLGMRLNWSKRYITLGPVATVIGLAFRLHDPERLLGGDEDLGITVALIPADLPGIDIGSRHDPLGVPFQNGPNFGRDVFVPLDFIVGGPAMAGKGWRMLMECLAAGRSISLPSLSSGATQLAARVAGDYATVREQFDTPIGRFEGIEEPLARIGGLTYILNAARRLTLGAVDAGQKPAVISAIVKRFSTETMRQVVNDAMDIQAGAAICRGPRNLLAGLYQAAPIGITVEGANILTRCLIIYGQGAIRCHPHVRTEMEAIAARDVVRLDRALFKHVSFVAKNVVRSLWLGVTRGRLARGPVGAVAGPYFGQLTRLAAAYAFVSDVAMGTLGGQLKRREKLSGRLADALSWLYLSSATLKQFVADGQPARDAALFTWSVQYGLHQIETALRGLIDNFPSAPVRLLLRLVAFPRGAQHRPPRDEAGAAVARGLTDRAAAGLELTREVYVPAATLPGLGRLALAAEKVTRAAAVKAKVRHAHRQLNGARGPALWDAAAAAGVITAEERRVLAEADALRADVIQVDAFPRARFVGAAASESEGTAMPTAGPARAS